MVHKTALRCLAAGLLCAGWAHAEGASPSPHDIRAAGEAFDLGKRAYKQRAWVEAAEQFEKADAWAPSAVALELAMRSRDKAAQLDRAAMLAALARVRHPEQAELVKSAAAIIKRAKKELHEVIVRCTPACDIVVGTKLVHGAPATERTLFLVPGGVAVRAGWSGDRARSAPVKAVVGGSTELSFEAPAEAAAPPEGTDAAKSEEAATAPSGSAARPQPQTDVGTKQATGLPPLVFFVGAGLTAVAGGITIWSGLDTRSNPGADVVRERCVGQGTSCPEYQDGLSRQRRTNVLIGATAVLGLTTAVVGAFFTDWSSSSEQQRAQVEPWVGVGALGARGRF